METKAKTPHSKNPICVGHYAKKWTRGLKTCDSCKIWMSNATTRLNNTQPLGGLKFQSNFGFSPIRIRKRYAQNKQHKYIHLKQLHLLTHCMPTSSYQCQKVFIYKSPPTYVKNSTNQSPPKLCVPTNVKPILSTP